MDVLSAAFDAAQPPETPTKGGGHGVCARCAASDGEMTATRTVVSKVFTAYDDWHAPGGASLCAACTWAYSTPALRRHPHMVTTTPHLTSLSPARLREVLRAPVRPDVAVVVPLHPGRKHLLPMARWGQVTVDDACLAWSTSDARRLDAMFRLRRLGFGPKKLIAAAPSWPVLRRLSSHGRATVYELWPLLEPWRRSRLWFDLATTATLPAAS